MIKALYARIRQGHRTVRFPAQPPTLPDRFFGRPALNPALCADGCRRCVEVCPSGAVRQDASGRLQLDLGRCIFCGACAKACQSGALRGTVEYRMAARRRDDLILRDETFRVADALERRSRSLFGRSLKLRQVSAGGCNACEADNNVLTTVVFDLGRFGIQFVASPRHADGILVTGPVPQNMVLALKKTYDAVPTPKLVIAVGACAISGGIYAGNPEAGAGTDAHLPVDLYVPGCPPHPITILDGLLRLLGRIEEQA